MRKILLLSFLFVYYYSFSQEISLNYSDRISPDSIRQYLYFLASDSLEGRETGKKGQKLAANYLASKYYSWQLSNTGTNKHKDAITVPPESFFQDHTINLRNNKGRNLSVNATNFLYGKDFIYAPPKNDTTIFLNNLLFIGSSNNSNIKNVILSDRYSGKNFLIYDRENQTENFFPLISSLPGNEKSVFIITNGEKIKKYFSEGFSPELKPSFHLFFITEELAKNLFPPDKFVKTNRKVARRSRPVVKELECELSVGITANDEKLRGQNIVAMIPGSEIKNETIVISSHYDHLGIIDSSIYYGADDNGSGTSAVLEIARVFKQAQKEGNGPRRNILFLNVSGEEKGLLGSSWFVANPAIPLKDIVANLNIDMIGRTDSIHDSTNVCNYIYVIGSDRLSTQLHSINEDQNKKHPMLVLDYKYNAADDPNNFYKRSDHYNFAKNGIPVIFYFDGIHADYHMPSDIPEKIDYNLLSDRAKLIFLTAWELANRNERILVDKK